MDKQASDEIKKSVEAISFEVAKTVMTIAESLVEKGIEKGIEKGKIEGKIEAANSLLDILDDETISKKLSIPIEEVKNYVVQNENLFKLILLTHIPS